MTRLTCSTFYFQSHTDSAFLQSLNMFGIQQFVLVPFYSYSKPFIKDGLGNETYTSIKQKAIN